MYQKIALPSSLTQEYWYRIVREVLTKGDVTDEVAVDAEARELGCVAGGARRGEAVLLLPMVRRIEAPDTGGDLRRGTRGRVCGENWACS